ncbi:MAG: hypothetical protein HY646_20030 [Acidobacteria bacterium]|nr:hypothetical protein [Acidobacteriota bacterium]
MPRAVALIVLFSLLIPSTSLSWGEKGHFMVNRLAIEAAASKLPEFMNASREQIVYNSYEPDRWRDESQSPMHIAQAPDHFIDSELWGPLGTLPADRYKFMDALIAKKVELVRIGYVPYSIIETYGRLVNAFRYWRKAQTPADREAARANAVFYAGVLGHYVGDASQPMHMSIHYNGWADGQPNPKNFTKDRRFHSRYEGAYVNAAVNIAAVRPKVQPTERLKDVWAAIKDYLNKGFSDLETVYEMEKTGEFNPEAPRPKGTDFMTTELARGATMLANLWYTAWLESGEPLPSR